MAKAVLKIRREGEVYRLTLHEEPSYDAVVAAVAQVWPEYAPLPADEEGNADAAAAAAATGALRGEAKYLDDEGDLCTLTPHTFDDFLMVHGGDGTGARVLKLELKPPAPAPPPAPAQAAPAAPAAAEAPASALAEVPAEAGPPPGLAEAGLGEAAGAWRRGCGGCTGPKKLLQVLKALQQKGELSESMLTSLALEGLPAMTQRVARKVDKINHVAKNGLGATARSFLEHAAEVAAASPGLEAAGRALQEQLQLEQGPADLGETLLRLLKSVGAMGFEAKTQLVQKVVGKLLPLLEDIAPEVGLEPHEWEEGVSALWLQHFGVACDACGECPVVGPRFRCPVCPDYDLCGKCYPQKQEFHKDCPAATQEFLCILHGKGKGKGKGMDCHWWKGFGKGGGKGFPPAWQHAWGGSEEQGAEAGTEAGEPGGWPGKGKGCWWGGHPGKGGKDWKAAAAAWKASHKAAIEEWKKHIPAPEKLEAMVAAWKARGPEAMKRDIENGKKAAEEFMKKSAAQPGDWWAGWKGKGGWGKGDAWKQPEGNWWDHLCGKGGKGGKGGWPGWHPMNWHLGDGQLQQQQDGGVDGQPGDGQPGDGKPQQQEGGPATQ